MLNYLNIKKVKCQTRSKRKYKMNYLTKKRLSLLQLSQIKLNKRKQNYFKKRLDDLKGTIDGVLVELNDLDWKYKDIQRIVDQESTQFNKLSKDVELIEEQKKIIETRMKNQQKLEETLKILLSGLSLTDEEAICLKNPTFSSSEDLRRAEDVVEKVGKFLQFQVDQFRNVKIFQDQVSIMNKELASFTNQFNKDLYDVAKKSSAAASVQDEEGRDEKGTEAYLSAIDMSSFKQALMKRRRLIKSLIQAKSGSPDVIGNIMTGIQRGAKYIIEQNKKQLRKNLKQVLDRSAMIKGKCSFTEKLNAKITSLVNAESMSNPNSLMQWFQDLLNQISGQIDLDLNYWTKFFTFDQKKYTKDDPDIQTLINDSYSPLFSMINELVDECLQTSPLSVYCFLTSTMNYLTAKKDEDEEETEIQTVVQDNRSSINSYMSIKSQNKIQLEVDNTDNISMKSGSNRKESVNIPAGEEKSQIMEDFLLNLKKNLESKKKKIAHQYQEYLQSHDYKVKYAPPFEQSVFFGVTLSIMHLINYLHHLLSIHIRMHLDS